MILPDHPCFAIDPDVCGAGPVIMGTRVRVSDILDALASGDTTAEIVANFRYLSRGYAGGACPRGAGVSGSLEPALQWSF